MHTEFPVRDSGDQEAASITIAALAASSMHDCVLGTTDIRALKPSADDQALVDLRYEPLMARVALEDLMSKT